MRNETTPSVFTLAAGLRSERVRAKELGLHPITLARARHRGELAFCRIGDRVLYSDGHITDWLRRNEIAVSIAARAA